MKFVEKDRLPGLEVEACLQHSHLVLWSPQLQEVIPQREVEHLPHYSRVTFLQTSRLGSLVSLRLAVLLRGLLAVEAGLADSALVRAALGDDNAL